MQALKQHKKIILVAVLLVFILIVSLLIVQNISKPSPKPKPSPTATPSPVPTQISPTPTSTTSPTPTPTPTSISPVATPSLYPGEVTQYQGYSLNSITDFIDDIIQHPDVAIKGTQNINRSTYNLTVTGLVNNTLEYTYSDVIDNFPSDQQVITLLCVEGWSVVCLYEGVPVYDLLQAAGISPNATTIIFYASDGYSTALPLNYIVQNNIILAYKINNVTLPSTLGFPFMLIATNQYGYKWIKWVTEIDASNNSSYLGYWESRGYPNNATIVFPENSTLHINNVTIVEVTVVSVAVMVIAAAIYITKVKPKTQQPKTLEPPEVKQSKYYIH